MTSGRVNGLRGEYASRAEQRLTVEVHLTDGPGALAHDARVGLGATPKWLPPKYFYDDLGSRLFDAICDTPEYYQTRTEQQLLESVVDDLVLGLRPTDVVELGSGAARKTRAVLDAIGRAGANARYVPFDVSESMLRSSAASLLADYDWLTVHGVVGDYDRHLDRIPPGDRRLYMFLGSTIGNFTELEAVRFLSTLARGMAPGDRLMLGVDLVKDKAVLDAAYNDSQGITARFNKNVLAVLNRELGATFDLDRFEHHAFFDVDKSRIEMHLRSSATQQVEIRRLELSIELERGETILTEISRKFSRASATHLLEAAGLRLESWFTPDGDGFGLAVAQRR